MPEYFLITTHILARYHTDYLAKNQEIPRHLKLLSNSESLFN